MYFFKRNFEEPLMFGHSASSPLPLRMKTDGRNHQRILTWHQKDVNQLLEGIGAVPLQECGVIDNPPKPVAVRRLAKKTR